MERRRWTLAQEGKWMDERGVLERGWDKKYLLFLLFWKIEWMMNLRTLWLYSRIYEQASKNFLFLSYRRAKTKNFRTTGEAEAMHDRSFTGPSPSGPHELRCTRLCLCNRLAPVSLESNTTFQHTVVSHKFQLQRKHTSSQLRYHDKSMCHETSTRLRKSTSNRSFWNISDSLLRIAAQKVLWTYSTKIERAVLAMSGLSGPQDTFSWPVDLQDLLLLVLLIWPSVKRVRNGK